MLRQQLADAKADAQKRLEQLDAKLADTETAKNGLAEMQRQLDRESKDRAAALEREATAQQLLRGARLHIDTLEKEVSMLQADLADAKADAQKRLEQLGAKVSDIEVAKNEQNELLAQLIETQREHEGSQRQVRLSWSPLGNAGV